MKIKIVKYFDSLCTFKFNTPLHMVKFSVLVEINKKFNYKIKWQPINIFMIVCVKKNLLYFCFTTVKYYLNIQVTIIILLYKLFTTAPLLTQITLCVTPYKSGVVQFFILQNQINLRQCFLLLDEYSAVLKLYILIFI